MLLWEYMVGNNGFTRKKVESLTLGERLQKLRGEFRMSLNEVSRATKIQVKYLECLESGQYGKLPAEVYVRGFLRSYARHLGVPEDVLLRLYDKERHIQNNLGHREASPRTIPQLPLTFGFSVTPKMFIGSFSVVVAVVAVAYLFIEFRNFSSVPRLVVTAPLSGATVNDERITVTGESESGAKISINDQPVFVGTDGSFSEKISLRPGANTLAVTAENRFGKIKTETLLLMADYMVPDAAAAPQAKGTEDTFTVTVRISGKPVKAVFEVDGSTVWSGTLDAGTTQTLSAKESVRIMADDGGAILTRFGSGSESPLGVSGEPLQEAFFTKDGRTR